MITRTKKISLLGVALFALSALFLGAKAADKKENESAYCLTISGKVLTYEKTNRNKIKIYLIKDNAIIDSLKTNVNVIFSFQLKKNEEYSIKIVEQGVANRLISVSTRLPEKVKKNLFFEFHFDLVPFTPLSDISQNADVLDFPVALIYYNPQKGCFDYNRKYTSQLKKAYKQI